jgi:D-beta-D-heptose 7-phosphate kinase/D-beta-D-heptose 1-phosphate adenosyltransferase
MAEAQRTTVLSALEVVDAVITFEEDTPLNLIRAIKPNVLIKGGDYTRESVVGADIVEELGGHIELVPLVPGISTSYLAAAIEKL